jgi:ABC-type transport system involved in multi-copper enzyme maturation permease subunit
VTPGLDGPLGGVDRGVVRAEPSTFRLAVVGFCYLVRLSFQRQARVRQMVWIALGLLAFTTAVIGLNTVGGRWSMGHWRWWWLAPGPLAATSHERRERPVPPSYVGVLAVAPDAGVIGGVHWGALYYASDEELARSQLHLVPAYRPRWVILNYDQTATGMETMAGSTAWSPEAGSLQQAIAGASRAVLDRSGFLVFSNFVVFSIFLSFLLPIWSLSFATEALGGDRESRTLLWVLARPIPRPAVYLAKYVALLPWSVGLSLGGFALLCLAAGQPGRMALGLYWPAVLLGTLAFSSLFHLMGAAVRRPAVVAIVYAFFLETILGNMPGYLKRVSISFYTRCLMFEQVERLNIEPVHPTVYMPVSGPSAFWILVGLTVGLLLVGMVVFARREYREEA